MRIAVAQTKPFKGDVAANIARHKDLVENAFSRQADLLVFPELSITGYEPILAEALATTPYDKRFSSFQEMSDEANMMIGVGMPTRWKEGLCISLVIFRPQQNRLVYSKEYLHADEEPFFRSGKSFTPLIVKGTPIGLAICYEISVPEHAERAAKSGATLYLASVAKSVRGIDKALERLSDIASTYALPVLMSNCIGECDGMECAGKSSIFNEKGDLIGQLDGAQEGILLLDTESGEVIEQTL